MHLGFFKGITEDLRLSDNEYVKNEEERFVPFSINPFREPQETTQGNQANNEEGERPSEWMELAGDLAWTTSFSSLTSNTAVTDPLGICNYAVFFALTWHLWATQTSYDVKYYTNDWWHRALFLSQLIIYGLLAALSSSFNVGWHLSSDAMNPFTGESSAFTGEAIREHEVNSMARSFTGVNSVIFVSRVFLLAQYLRVNRYRRKSNQFWSWRFNLLPLSTFVAACIFLTCSLMIREADGNKAVAVTQLTLWGIAVSIQILAAALTPKDNANALKSRSTMAPRLSTLTVIIIGEGLNGLCNTLRHIINTVGMELITVAEVIISLLIFYCFWVLYFDGFWINKLTSVVAEEAWLWAHFPLHLCLIMMFEGIKNVHLFDNVTRVTAELVGHFWRAVDDMDEFGNLPEHPYVERLLVPLKMSWQQEILEWNMTRANITSGDQPYAATAQLFRWIVSGMHNVYVLFSEEPDPQAEYLFNAWVSRNDTAIAQNLHDDGISMTSWIARYQELMASSESWLMAVSGTLLICTAALNVMRRRPQNRHAWGYPLVRAGIGALLIVIGGAKSKSRGPGVWLASILPLIMGGYIAAAIAESVVLCKSIRTIRVKRASLRQVEAQAWELEGVGPRLY